MNRSFALVHVIACCGVHPMKVYQTRQNMPRLSAKSKSEMCPRKIVWHERIGDTFCLSRPQPLGGGAVDPTCSFGEGVIWRGSIFLAC